MKIFLSIIFMLVVLNVSLAQADTLVDEAYELYDSSDYAYEDEPDSLIYSPRLFNEGALNEMKKDDAFQYENLKEPALNWWDKFWMWFWWKVNQLLNSKNGKNALWYVLIALGILVLAFAIIKIRKMNRTGLFMNTGGKGLAYTIGEEDIHQIAFDDAINSAVAQKNFRLAVRLLYLQSLKILTDKSIIEWKINKTNNDYVREVKANPWQPLFSKLTYQFEYAWYGEANVTPEKFEVLRQEFKQLHNLV